MLLVLTKVGIGPTKNVGLTRRYLLSESLSCSLVPESSQILCKQLVNTLCEGLVFELSASGSRRLIDTRVSFGSEAISQPRFPIIRPVAMPLFSAIFCAGMARSMGMWPQASCRIFDTHASAKSNQLSPGIRRLDCWRLQIDQPTPPSRTIPAPPAASHGIKEALVDPGCQSGCSA